jgi:hypothetical protein
VGDKIGRTRLRPGDRIPIKGLEVRVIASAGELIREPLASAGAANPVCVTAKQPARIERDIEDDQSVGVLYSYGGFRMFDPADLEGHLTHALACPNNLIGTVDVYHLNVHGQFKGLAEAAVGALRPQVILLGNGARKGGDRDTWPVLRQAAPAADIWQVHFSENAGSDRNPSENFIANPQGNDGCHGIRISVEPGGKTFTVINERNGYRKTYTTARQSAK